MIESIIRELCRMQDTLVEFVPQNLWHNWAIANEAICDYLQVEINNKGE